MIYILQNLLPIGLATILGLTIGLGWLKTSGQPLPAIPAVAVAAVAEFWLAAILAGALILAPDRAGPWQMALGSAFIIWVGFVMPAFVVTLRTARQAWGTVASACLHWLVVMLAQAALMQTVGLTAPPGT